MVVEWTDPLTISDVLGGVLSLVVGLAVHELAHLSAFFFLGYTPRFRWRPDVLGAGFEPQTVPPRHHAVFIAMAPLGAFLLGMVGVVMNTALPLGWWELLVIVGFGAATIPSPPDWQIALSYRPDPDRVGGPIDG